MALIARLQDLAPTMAAGYVVHTGLAGTGVVVGVRRADMDALPIT